jgi:hypothetical protein
LTSEKNYQKKQDEQIVVFGDRQFPDRRRKSTKQEEKQRDHQCQTHKTLSKKRFMRNYLKQVKVPYQFKMTDEQQYQSGMEQNQKNPQYRFVSSDGWKAECVIQGSQPFRFFFRIDLKGRGVFGPPENLDNPDKCPQDEDTGGKIDHGYQNDVENGLQDTSYRLKLKTCHATLSD